MNARLPMHMLATCSYASHFDQVRQSGWCLMHIRAVTIVRDKGGRMVKSLLRKGHGVVKPPIRR